MIYGLDIPKESSFWDEVKLRALNNFGNADSKSEMVQNVGLAIEDIFQDITQTILESRDRKQLEKEIEENQD